MKLIQSIFLICLMFFANLNIYVYQNWCHGENVGYTVNSKKFISNLKDFNPHQTPSLKKDNCCKDVLIKSSQTSFFSFEKAAQNPVITGVISEFYWRPEGIAVSVINKTPQLYRSPPPIQERLYQFYCRYTYYG